MKQKVHAECKIESQPRMDQIRPGGQSRDKQQQSQLFARHYGKHPPRKIGKGKHDPAHCRWHAAGQKFPVPPKPGRQKQHLLRIVDDKEERQRPHQQRGQHAVIFRGVDHLLVSKNSSEKKRGIS